MLDAGVQFDEAEHTYTVSGKVLPSVTTILKAALTFGGASPDVLRNAMERGTAVHKAVELELEGTLDHDELDPRIAPYLQQFNNFRAATAFRATHCEQVVHSERYGYAGMLDLLGTFPALRHDEIAEVDIKSGLVMPVTVGPQTSGYEIAARETLRIGSHIRIKRYALQLRPDFWKLHPLQNALDSTTFLSAVHLWRWCRDNKIA
jgi:hypothetical protein